MEQLREEGGKIASGGGKRVGDPRRSSVARSTKNEKSGEEPIREEVYKICAGKINL